MHAAETPNLASFPWVSWFQYSNLMLKNNCFLILRYVEDLPSMVDNSINVTPSLKFSLPVGDCRERCNYKEWTPDTIPLQKQKQKQQFMGLLMNNLLQL